MIQFNLLPDVKLEYIRAERTKRLVMSAAVIVSSASVVILLLLLGVDAAQKARINNLTASIKKQNQTLQSQKDIDTILTVQNQLNSLTALHNTKPAVNRLFGYLNQLTPANVSIASLTIDFNQHTVQLSGQADNLGTVNQFIDTLKLTKYSTGDTNSTTAFNNVVLTSFTVAGSGTGAGKSSFSVTMSYDSTIFDITKDVSLSVPNEQTRAQVQNPTDLFQDQSSSSTTGAKQ